MYRLPNSQSVVWEIQQRRDHTRVYLITGLFYYSLEIEMFFPFNRPSCGPENTRMSRLPLDDLVFAIPHWLFDNLYVHDPDSSMCQMYVMHWKF